MSRGRTRPVVLACVRQEGEASTPLRERTMLVKAPALPEVVNHNMFCEAVGNLMARAVGVQTAEPAIVDLAEDFVEAANYALGSYNLRLEPGFGVGCEFVRGGFAPLVVGSTLTPDELAQAALIYGFDLLVQNPDRLPHNPNCAIHGDRLVAYDFETCFSFLLLIGQQFPAWEVSKHRINQNHLFHKALARHEVKWEPLLDGVRDLTDGRLDELCHVLPEEWQESAVKVCGHVATVRKDLPKFHLELQRSLT